MSDTVMHASWLAHQAQSSDSAQVEQEEWTEQVGTTGQEFDPGGLEECSQEGQGEPSDGPEEAAPLRHVNVLKQ